MVAENQLFFSVACTMNDVSCVAAMRWFREQVFFSRDYSDIPRQLLEYSEDQNMLKVISDYAKAADLGIYDMHFEFERQELREGPVLPDNIPDKMMNLELLRKDQIYFVDKNNEDGTSELYSISEFSTRTSENIRKGYLVGKYGATPDIEIEEVE